MTQESIEAVFPVIVVLIHLDF